MKTRLSFSTTSAGIFSKHSGQMEVVVLMTRSKVKSARENLMSGGVMFTRSRGLFKLFSMIKVKRSRSRQNPGFAGLPEF